MTVPRAWFPRHYAETVQRLRVSTGFLLAAAFLYLAQPSKLSLAAGLPVAALGLLLRSWAAGHLAKNETLTTGGPFAFTRNPLYLGTLVTALGFAAAAQSAALVVLFAAAFLLIYLPVIEREQEHLIHLFPGYPAYAAQVPMLLPRLTPYGKPGGFRFSVWRRNKEYKAAAGFALVTAYLVWRAGLFS